MSYCIDTTNEESFAEGTFAEKFSYISSSSHVVFAELIDSLSKTHAQNLFWWISQTADRNTNRNSLFHNFCLVIAIKEICETRSAPEKIFVGSAEIKKLIQDVIGQNCPEISVKQKKIPLKTSIKNFLRPLNFLLNKTLQWALIRVFFKNNSYTKPINIIETFATSKDISINRYYPNVEDFLPSEIQKITYYVPTIINSKVFNIPALITKFKQSKVNFLFRESYLNWRDILSASMYLNYLPKTTIEPITYKAIDFSKIIATSLNNETFNALSAEGVLNYQFVKRMREQGMEINQVIDWWENTPMDKGLNLALAKYFDQALIKGYLGFTPNINAYELSPSCFEQESNVTPCQIGVIGKGYDYIPKRIGPNQRVFVAPALRFHHLWKTNNTASKNTILVILTGFIDESIGILKMLLKINSRLKNEKIIIKTHPAVNTDVIRRGIINPLPDNCVIAENESLSDLLAVAYVAISGLSSGALEAIVCSVPAIVVQTNRNREIQMIPDKIPKYSWQECSNHNELYKSIMIFKNSKEFSITLKKEAASIKDIYFNKPDKENVKNFLL